MQTKKDQRQMLWLVSIWFYTVCLCICIIMFHNSLMFATGLSAVIECRSEGQASLYLCVSCSSKHNHNLINLHLVKPGHRYSYMVSPIGFETMSLCLLYIKAQCDQQPWIEQSWLSFQFCVMSNCLIVLIL